VFETVFGLPLRGTNGQVGRPKRSEVTPRHARFVLGGVGADDPQRVGMLLEAALLEATMGLA